MNIQEIRKKYPQYNDMSDSEFADKFHGKYYSDIPKEEFYQKIGIGQNQKIEKPQQPQRLQGLPFLQDWAESLEKHPALKKVLGATAKNVAEPIVNTVESLRIPEIAGGIINTPLSIAKSFGTPMPEELRTSKIQFNPEDYARNDFLSKAAFMGGEFLGFPGAPSAAKAAAKAVPAAIKNSKYTSENILKKVIGDESAYKEKYKNLYEGLWKEADKAKVSKIEFPKKGTNKLRQNINYVIDNELPNYTTGLENFIANPSVKNAHEAKSELSTALRDLYSKKAINKRLDPHERRVFQKVYDAKKGLENAMEESFAKSKNPGLSKKYKDITKGYADEVVPYSKLPALSKYKEGKLKPERFAQKLSNEQSDAFMLKKEKLYPEIKRRENAVKLAKILGIGGGAVAGADWGIRRVKNLLEEV